MYKRLTNVVIITRSSRITGIIGRVLLSVCLFMLPVNNLKASAFNGSVKKSLDHHLLNNRDYNKNIADWKTARQNVRIASSAAFPSINFNWDITKFGNVQSFNWGQYSTDNNPPEELDVAAENTFKGSLSIEQQLFSSNMFGAIRVAKSY